MRTAIIEQIRKTKRNIAPLATNLLLSSSRPNNIQNNPKEKVQIEANRSRIWEIEISKTLFMF